ncbi:MAG: Mov34/MPN/PAD-1 family protein [Candidatus Acidiferrales bacterium]
MALEMSGTLLEEIGRHGARAYPNECCGAMLGVASEDGRKEVRALLALDNRREGEAARTRFLITAEDHLWAEKRAREQGLDIVGFYHSHPDHPARPSEFDREHALPWYSYVVVRVARDAEGQAREAGGATGGKPQETTSWVLADDRSEFLPEEIFPPAASNS